MKFAADAMLGKLALWLRALGHDTTYEKDIEDDVLIRRSKDEGRLLLTRDTRMVRRLTPGEYLFIRDNAPIDQLRQAVSELGLSVDSDEALTRCLRCNTALTVVDKESVKGLVPDYTFERTSKFHRCPGCGRVYWPGTHEARMRERLNNIAGEGNDRTKL